MSTVDAISVKTAVALPGSPTGEAKNVKEQRPSRLPAPVHLLGARPPLLASYQYDPVLRQVIVTLQNPETGGVVREIPAEQVRKLAAALMQAAQRVLDSKA